MLVKELVIVANPWVVDMALKLVNDDSELPLPQWLGELDS